MISGVVEIGTRVADAVKELRGLIQRSAVGRFPFGEQVEMSKQTENLHVRHFNGVQKDQSGISVGVETGT